MPHTEDTAEGIIGKLLLITGEALMADDFETFHAQQHLPQPIETFEGRKFVTTSGQMRNVFTAVRAHHRRIGVTRIIRTVTSAKFVDENNIEAVYESRVYRRDELVQVPYPAYSMVRKIEGRWKVVYCMYAIPDAQKHSEALLNVPDANSEKTLHDDAVATA